MNTRRKVILNKISAVVWLMAGAAAFAVGWHDAVWAVWVASVYANAKTDWSTAEAADDSAILAELRELRRQLGGRP